MKPYQMLGVMAVGLILPIMAIAEGDAVLASEVRVKTANVEAITRQDGSIYVNTAGTTIAVPQRRVRSSWNPWRYWSVPWRSQNRDRQGQLSHNCYHSYQYSQQTTRLDNQTLHSSTIQHCN